MKNTFINAQCTSDTWCYDCDMLMSWSLACNVGHKISKITSFTVTSQCPLDKWCNSYEVLLSKVLLVILSLTIILYTLAISPGLWGSRQHRRNNKTMGISLRSSGNDEGPSRVWMALLGQHSPSSPVFHNLRRFIYAISPTAPTTELPL